MPCDAFCAAIRGVAADTTLFLKTLIMKESEALQRCADWCSQSEHCISELREKLSKFGVEPDAAQRIEKQLIDERFVDERRYTEYYVRDKARFNGWGPMKIRFQLSLKRIDSKIVDEVLRESDSAIFDEQLERALRNKLRLSKNADKQKLRAALLRFGASRGFDYQAVYQAVGRLVDDD